MTETLPRGTELLAAMAVEVPPGRSGDVAVSRFEVSEQASKLDRMRSIIQGHPDRYVPAGEYTKLTRRGGLWMSDTPAERYDHVDFVLRAMHSGAQRVLVNGLGLGMVVRALLRVPSVTQVDVCEIDPDVIALVGPHVTALGEAAGKSVQVVQGDAFTPSVTWGPGRRWNAAWHDVWQDICADDYEDHKRIRRSYARRVTGFQDVWMADEVRRLHRTGSWR